MTSGTVQISSLIMDYLSSEKQDICDHIESSSFEKELRKVYDQASSEEPAALFGASAPADDTHVQTASAGTATESVNETVEPEEESGDEEKSSDESVYDRIRFSSKQDLLDLIGGLRLGAEERESIIQSLESEGSISLKDLLSILKNASSDGNALLDQGEISSRAVSGILQSATDGGENLHLSLKELNLDGQSSFSADELREMLAQIANSATAGETKSLAASAKAEKEAETKAAKASNTKSATESERLVKTAVPNLGGKSAKGGASGEVKAADAAKQAAAGEEAAKEAADSSDIGIDEAETGEIAGNEIKDTRKNNDPADAIRLAAAKERDGGLEHASVATQPDDSTPEIPAVENVVAAQTAVSPASDGGAAATQAAADGDEAAATERSRNGGWINHANSGSDASGRQAGAKGVEAGADQSGDSGEGSDEGGDEASHGGSRDAHSNGGSGNGNGHDGDQYGASRQSANMAANAARNAAQANNTTSTDEFLKQQLNNAAGLGMDEADLDGQGSPASASFLSSATAGEGESLSGLQGSFVDSIKGINEARADATQSTRFSFTNRWQDELAQRFGEMRSNNRNQLVLQLNPRELGSMVLRISANKSEVRAWISTSSEKSRQVLLENSTELREALKSQGFDLAGLDVDVQEEKGGKSGSGQWTQARMAGAGRSGVAMAASGTVVPAAIAAAPATGGERLISLVA